MFLLFAIIPTTGLYAQTNTLSGSLINAPGNSSQTIPSRPVVFERYSGAPTVTLTANTNTSNNYSITYTGGPIFWHNNARVYVDLGSANNPVVDVSSLCFSSNDINILVSHLNSGTTLSKVQRIAADVNMDGSLTSADKIMMDSVLLGYYSRFANSLAVAGTTYSDRTIVYPTTTEVASLGTAITYDCAYDFGIFNIPFGTNPGYDFYSIRLGDLDGNCATYNGFNDNGSGSISRLKDLTSPSTEDFSEIQVSPNPFVSDISINLSNVVLKSVSLLDFKGREIFTKSIGSTNSFNLNDASIAKLPAGIYLLRLVETDGTVTTRRLLKK